MEKNILDIKNNLINCALNGIKEAETTLETLKNNVSDEKDKDLQICYMEFYLDTIKNVLGTLTKLENMNFEENKKKIIPPIMFTDKIENIKFPIENFSTKELHDELTKRGGVDTYFIEPYKKIELVLENEKFQVKGPATIFVVID